MFLKTIKARREEAFTLVELLITVVILAVIMGIAIPVYVNNKASADSAAAKTQATLIVDSISSGIGTGDLQLIGFSAVLNTAPYTVTSGGFAGPNASITSQVGTQTVKAGTKVFRTGDNFCVSNGTWAKLSSGPLQETTDSCTNATTTGGLGVTVDYLVVAGGGGGAGMWYYELGGGGGGGLRSTVTATGGGGSLETALTLALSTNYTVTIGAGGAGAPGPLGGTIAQHTGTAGSNSVFSTITSTGGGGGAGSDGVSSSGGSGGGGGGTGASGTANQGYAGGNSTGGGGYSLGGGGGGAGAVGGNGVNPNAGNGGAGVATSISGSSVTYGGGGGGGTYDSANVGSGGSGGGGNANNNAAGSDGTVNRGGGGGAGVRNGGIQYVGGAGGSGVVILKYPDTKTITIGAGLTGTTAAPSGGFKVTTITAGTGTVSWN